MAWVIREKEITENSCADDGNDGGAALADPYEEQDHDRKQKEGNVQQEKHELDYEIDYREAADLELFRCGVGLIF
jgi:hypothetical protein